MTQYLGDESAHFTHFRFAESTRGDRRRTQANAARIQRRIHVEWNRILVDGDRRPVERLFRIAAADALGKYIDQHQVVVSPTGYHAKTGIGQCRA